ncbi:DUF6468 domain-containing protein [Magnetovibrio sp. PR-2]|uniref:DUF6468 domain-containing protein n=1 Tax=Magnetovibrio sp. PR-2 TaxID=3120356 RepID=UPI002FCE1FDE
MQIGLILDSVIVVLLVLTITYAARLNQRLSQLRGDKKELQALAKTFADATAKAETGIKNLKISSDSLQSEVEKAHALRDDLEYLVQRGGKAADSMVDTVSKRNEKVSMPRRQHRQSDEVEDLLIEEAIRAAKPLAEAADQDRPQGRPQGRPEGRSQDHSQDRNRGNMFAPAPQPSPRTAQRAPEGALRALAQSTPKDPNRRSVGHPEPKPAPLPRANEGAQSEMGGGLGGLSPEDRLLDEHLNRSRDGSIGESDAARELLKALSSVK